MLPPAKAVLFAVTILLVLLAPAPALAQTAPFEFAETGPVNLPWSDTGKPVAVDVVNNTMNTYQLQVTVTDMKFVAADSSGRATSTEIPTSEIVSVVIGGDLLPANSRTVLVSVKQNSTVAPGAYKGQLIVSGQGQAIHRTLVLTVPGAAPLKPAVEKWSLTLFRLAPFAGDIVIGENSQWPGNTFLPMESGPITDTRTVEFGRLVGSAGGTALIKPSGAIEELPAGVVGLGLKVEGLTRPGSYTGEIDLAPGNDAEGVVALTVNATDFILWPILALLAGLGLAAVVQRFVGVKRTVFLLREQQAQQGIDYDAAKRVVHNAAGGTFRGFNIDKAVAELCAKIHEAITKLDRESKFKIAKEAEQAIADDLRELSDLIGQFKRLPDTLIAMEKRLKEVAEAAPAATKPSNYQEALPKVVIHGRSLSKGGELSAQQLKDRLSNAEKVTTLAGKWVGTSKLEREQRIDVEELIPKYQDDDEKSALADLKEAEGLLNVVVADLWEAQDNAEFEAGETAEKLTKAGEIVDQLTPPEPRSSRIHKLLAITRPSDNDLENILRTSNLALLVDNFRNPPVMRPHESDEATLVRNRSRRQISERALLWLAVFIALYTGLDNLYFGETFGTPLEYLEAILWGLITKAALEGVFSLANTIADLRVAGAK